MLTDAGYRQVKNLAERDCPIKCRQTATLVEDFHSGDTNINTYAESYYPLCGSPLIAKTHALRNYFSKFWIFLVKF